MVRPASSKYYANLYCKNNFKECARRFPVALYGRDNSSKQDKFVLSVPADQLKAVVTLTGDSITSAVSICSIIYFFIVSL